MTDTPNKKDGRYCAATAQSNSIPQEKVPDMNNINSSVDARLRQYEKKVECGRHISTSNDDLFLLTTPKGCGGFRLNQHLATLSVAEYSNFTGISKESISAQIANKDIPHLVLSGQAFIILRRYVCPICEPLEQSWVWRDSADE